MLKAIIVAAVLFCAAEATNDCPLATGPRKASCPLQEVINGVQTCYAAINADFGSAYTRGSGDKACKDRFGAQAHLANIYDKKCFEDARCYIIEDTSISGSLDRKVLLGMSYDSAIKETRLYDGEILPGAYWGERSRPLSYGSNMILRASEDEVRSKLFNFGGATERYDRVLCEFPYEK